MWTSIRLRNFRLFEDTGEIALAPLTFLIGPNSGGKSTIIKALLLLKQSAESEDLNLPLEPKGRYCAIGRYQDFIFRSETDRNLGVKIEWIDQSPAVTDQTPSTPAAALEIQWSLDGVSNRIYVDKVDYYLKGSLEAATKRAKPGYLLKMESFGWSYPEDAINPIKYLRKLYGISETLGAEWGKTLGNERAEKFIKLNQIERSLLGELNNTTYLSSLRLDPKDIYPLPQARPIDVGIKGEWSPEHMALDANLTNQVSSWVKKLKIAREVKISYINNEYYSVRITNSIGHNSNLVNVGSGMPNVLPILAQGLFSNPFTTIIFEQPESDLNPGIQAELSDFFVHLVLDPAHRKQLIIETHSEHFLNRVRTWIAKGDLDREMVAVYYCFADEQERRGRVVRLEMNEFGKFQNWPEGFLFEEITEAMVQTEAVIGRKKRKADPEP